ncbi:hypothetical protein AQUCO_04300062v1 [Aquilegia coerulea]|uniref:F-box domain-containing protein n=1 Tax=Aquilegia coerulea TaxID=218851 RepID=A0A2G5CNH6_AQUCA|nr:hypothetical protein AQUCO_04300062v1 [Aquilegia coerulea]
MTHSVDWSQFPDDLLHLIGKKLDIVTDRFRFRSVCKSWRCSLPPFPKPPWLMLSEPRQLYKSEKYLNPPPLRGFVGISGDEQQEIKLPEAHLHRCIGSTDGYRGFGIPGGYDMGVFDMEDKSIQPHYKVK